MPHSIAQNAPLTCPACNRDFQAEIWLIIDGEERPDLLQRARDGTLHTLTCPHCGQVLGQADAPLLIYRPAGDPVLIFSPARGTSQAQDQEHAVGLLGMLRESLDDAWEDAWLEEMATVPRDLLALALSEDPEALLQQMAAQAAAELERLQQEDPDAYRALQEAAEQVTREDVEARERMGEEVKDPLQVLEEAGELGEHLLALLNEGSLENGRGVIKRYPDLLTEETEELIQRLLQVDNRAQVRGLVQAWQGLLRRCREVGIEKAFEERAAEGSGTDVPSELMPLIEELIRLNRPQDMQRRIALCQEILSRIDRQENPDLWGVIQVEMANSLADRIRGDRAENIEQAIRHFRNALEVFRPETLPDNARRTARLLGDLYYQQKAWSAAREAYEQAAAAANQLHLSAASRESMRHLASENAAMYARLVHACLQVDDPDAALAHIFAAKGRALADALSAQPPDARDLPAGLQQRLDQARDLAARIHGLESRQLQMDDPGLATVLARELAQLRRQEKAAWEAIRTEYPDFFRLQAGDPMDAAEAQVLADHLDATLVGYYRHAGGWLAYIFQPRGAAPVLVPLQVDERRLAAVWDAFHHRLSARARQTWRRLSDLHALLLAPLQAHLPPPDAAHPPRLVLAPFGALHLFPMAAMAWQDEDKRYHYLSDGYELAVTPNLAVLQRMVARTAHRNQREHLVAAAYPAAVDSPNHLPNVIPETEAIASEFPKATRLLGEEATIQNILDAGPDAQVLHIASHGRFHPDPTQAGLLLADGWLRVQDILYRLRLEQTTVATLSACVTGITQPDAGDELAGLTQAFMHAGAPAVVASLWTVDDASTRFLFQLFYAYYRAGISVSRSLQAAQQDLRVRGYDHPFFWAAFQPLGAAFHAQPVANWPRPELTRIPRHHSQTVRGAIMPTPQDILQDAKSMLQVMVLDADLFSEWMDASEQARLRHSLELLLSQAQAVENDDDLLALADALLKTIETFPVLREEFLGEVDPSQEQRNRVVSLEEYKKRKQTLTQNARERESIVNSIETSIGELIDALIPQTNSDDDSQKPSQTEEDSQ